MDETACKQKERMSSVRKVTVTSLGQSKNWKIEKYLVIFLFWPHKTLYKIWPLLCWKHQQSICNISKIMLAGFLKMWAVAVLCKAGGMHAVEERGLLRFLPMPRITSSQQAPTSYGSAVILSLSWENQCTTGVNSLPWDLVLAASSDTCTKYSYIAKRSFCIFVQGYF